MQISEIEVGSEHEQVLSCVEPEAGYRGIIAIHSTALGPSVGGARFWNYEHERDALTDALRLSRAMTYKNALAGLPLGGGKSVIIGDNRTREREAIFRAHGRFIESLGGRYITAEDVGTGTADMEYVLLETRHVAGLAGRSGDPSPATARGLLRALQASAKYRWGSENLEGRRIALQGCGHVGHYLARELHSAGARLFVTDIDAGRVRRAVEEFEAVAVEPAEIYGVEADIFAPCALGGILNARTIPQLRVEIVAGAANNQLLDARDGDTLAERAILYAPDYVANAGGIINGCIELLGWERARAQAKVEAIFDTVLDIFERAEALSIPTYKAADELAERRLQSARGGSDDGGQSSAATSRFA